MSMNFNNNPSPVSTPKPKKNNNKKIAEIIIVVVLGTIGALGLIHEVQRIQTTISSISSDPQPTSDLEQKLLIKCQNLQDYYNSIDVKVDYKCEQYAKTYSGLVK